MEAHAILSPSAAHRWLNCTPSARLELQFPDKAGSAASEGTLAHRLGELLIRYRTKQVTKPVYVKALAAIHADPQFEPAMMEYAEGYAVFVLEQFSEAKSHTKDAMLFLEQKLNLTDYIPEGFGTGDVVIIADGTMTIIDLKYGKGVPVSAEQNKQMMLYSLGGLRDFDFIYDIRKVKMVIYQPRLDSISSFEMTVTNLRAWAESELIPRAALAFEGNGDFNPGDHCRFCKAKAVCRAFAEFNLELAKHEFKDAALLKDMEISEILDRADTFTQWLAAVEEWALNEAVNNNKKWPGYKLVEGRSNRTYVDEEKVASKLLSAGLTENIIYIKKLLGITAMEKALGKSEFSKQLNDLVVKPPGKPTLVPESDKRPEYSSIDAAAKDFAGVTES